MTTHNQHIWIDITNTPQVHFLLAIQRGLDQHGAYDYSITARDFSETLKLLQAKTQLPYKVIGEHYGKSMTGKALGLMKRFANTYNAVDQYDVSLSCGSESAIWTSFLRRKISIAFGDNDLAKQWTYGRFVTKAIFPKSIPTEILTRQGISTKKLYQYNGFKEHVYLADFIPDPSFKQRLPFDQYVVVRPENIQANYVQQNAGATITPALLKQLSDAGENILYLPRYAHDRAFADGIKNIFIPDQPINGLDACYFSRGVFTGAGTFAREAACLGVPSFSFFLGEKLLAVDRDLVQQNKMYFSRDPNDLCQKFNASNRTEANLNEAKAVRDEVIDVVLKTIRS
jgi:predicted glycosyltransferase